MKFTSLKMFERDWHEEKHSYQAVFESCYEAMVAMLASEKYPITKKNLIFTAKDWLMDGDVLHLFYG